MMLQTAQEQIVSQEIGTTHTADGLSVIHRSDCAAAIWRRPVPEGFLSWINDLPAEKLPSARLVLRPDAVPQAVRQLCDQMGLQDGPQQSWLTADIADLALRFSDLMRAPYLQLRLDVIQTNACRRFHVDAIMARLICTYRGTGTQYGLSADGAAPQDVATLETGSPMIMRGSLWSETPKSGFLHRSPPIEGTGETRFVLVLDPVYNPDEI